MKFEIGEMALLLKAVQRPKATGKECEIIGYWYGGRYRIEIPGYPGPRGNGWLVEEIYLQKKQPPQEAPSWESLEEVTGWNPRITVLDPVVIEDA